VSRILFVMLHPGFVRYYDGAIDALAAAGHHVHVAFEVGRSKLGEDVTAQRLATRSPRITCGPTPERAASVRDFLTRGDRAATRSGGRLIPAWSREGRAEAWESLATTVRLLLDYLRFFEPAFANATALRARAEKRVPRIYRTAVRVVARGGRVSRSVLAAALGVVERLIPSPRALEAFIAGHRPDLLLVTPLIELGSQQVDYVKAARRLGIRSALCVASWDNLTSKGLIRLVPDHVLVWNDAQKREAVTLHGVPAGRVVVTGAHLFDRWFEQRPSRSREEFCRLVGLDPARPFILYVGSSIFIAPEEVPFAERWRLALGQATEPVVRSAAVLFRPHPANARQWRALDPDLPATTVWPPIGTDPNAPDFKRDLFDSLYHCAAVVGVNTSAQIEAAIVGRPVFTVRAPEFEHAQEGTLHFEYLAGSDGGFVRTAATLDEHVVQLADVLRGQFDPSATREFVASFIRPLGVEAPAVPAFAAAVGRLTELPARVRESAPWWVLPARPCALLLAQLARMLAEDRPLWVYLLRPVVAAGIWVWAGVLWLRHLGHGAQQGTKRLRRRAWSVWYEAGQRLRHRGRRAQKAFVRTLRTAGSAARRIVRGSA
jgi:hypothetical protein